jgi:hypothetical protein
MPVQSPKPLAAAIAIPWNPPSPGGHACEEQVRLFGSPEPRTQPAPPAPDASALWHRERAADLFERSNQLMQAHRLPTTTETMMAAYSLVSRGFTAQPRVLPSDLFFAANREQLAGNGDASGALFLAGQRRQQQLEIEGFNVDALERTRNEGFDAAIALQAKALDRVASADAIEGAASLPRAQTFP